MNSCRFCLFVVIFFGFAPAWAQQSPQQTTTLPPGASTQKINEYLSTLRPPISFTALENGNELQLSVPDISAQGYIDLAVKSTIPRTDAMWVMTMDNQPESGNALLTAITLDTAAAADIKLKVALYKTQYILLIARAGGRYYGVYKQVKLGPSPGPHKKVKAKS
jgi:predicted secreted protein